MAREIDLTQPLNEADRNYLLARGRESQVFANDAKFAGSGAVPYIPGFSTDRADGVPADPRSVPPGERGGVDLLEVSESEEDDETEDNYDTWTHDALQEEIRKRNEDRDAEDRIGVSGNKAELIARLREDDEDYDEDDEDDDSEEE